jgi:hypothetical protein
VWRTDEQGLPQFTRDMLPIVVPLIGTMATHARGVSGQYHPPPAAQIRIPRAETRKRAECRRPKPRPGISDFGFRPSFGPRISGFGFGTLRSRVGGTVQHAPCKCPSK